MEEQEKFEGRENAWHWLEDQLCEPHAVDERRILASVLRSIASGCPDPQGVAWETLEKLGMQKEGAE